MPSTVTTRLRSSLCAAAIVAALVPMPGAAQSITSVCYSRGSEADGMVGVTHFADGRAVRVDSPYSDDPRSRVIEWQDADYPATFMGLLEPVWSGIPEDLIAQCDDGWRDTIVIRYDDGSSDIREGSCARNPVAQTLDRIFSQASSLAESPTETVSEGAIEGVYAPCFQNW